MSSGWKSQYMALIGLLARRRKELRISQIDLAKQLKAGRRTFQRWEDGRVEPPAKRLFQWAAALGVTIAPDVAQVPAWRSLWKGRYTPAFAFSLDAIGPESGCLPVAPPAGPQGHVDPVFDGGRGQ